MRSCLRFQGSVQQTNHVIDALTFGTLSLLMQQLLHFLAQCLSLWLVFFTG